MTTKDTVEGYFGRLRRKEKWGDFFSEDMVFTSFTSPVKEVRGKTAYLASTKRFYSTLKSMEVRDVIVQGDKACALTHYELQPPGGSAFVSDVAEIFQVKEGKIEEFSIYFDTAPFPT